MPWRKVSLVEQRLEFVSLAERGELSFAELCRRFGVTRDTGYKWLRRYHDEGTSGLKDRSRRPHHSPRRTPEDVEELVRAVREQHPSWGGRKIRGFLLRQGHGEVPAPSTITSILRRLGLLADAEAPPRAYKSFEADRPNRLWQIDFKGWFRLRDRSPCHALGVLDDHSRYNLCLRACSDQKTATVWGHLVEAFRHYGLPEAMLMDNGSPWGHTLEWPWTPLTVWMVDLGVRVIHSRPFHPQTLGKEERFHRTLDLEVLHTRPLWDSFDQVQDAFDEWRPLYNYHRPHQSLGETIVPADRYAPSGRPYPEELPPVEYPAGYQLRKVWGNSSISFQGKRFKVGRAFTGKVVGISPTTTDGVWEVHYRHQPIRHLDLSTMSPNARR